MKPALRTACIAVLLLSACGDGAGDGRTRLLVYTSIYREILPLLDAALERELPDIEVEWYAAGSETIAARMSTELAAGRTDADVIMTSDPFWYLELKEAGHLASYDSPAAADVPAAWRDPDHAFCTVRLPVMVMACNPEVMGEKSVEVPRGFGDLGDERFQDLISMGDPAKSGTNFTTVTILSRRYGWEYFEKLRARNLLSAGGNSSVLNRIRTGERPVGVVLLENVLRARQEGATAVEAVFPGDGGVLVPSPVAILAGTKQMQAAQRFYDFMFSAAGQAAVVAGHMYSPLPGHAAPEGAPPLGDLMGGRTEWSSLLIAEVAHARESIKERFTKIVQE